MNKFTRVVFVVSLSFVSSNLFAHHSSAPHFDKELEVDVKGVVTDLKFVNPHAYLYFDEDVNGEMVNWRCELSSATQLKRFGWSADMFTVGEEITVNGNPARREDNVCYLNSLTLADGTTIARRDDLTKTRSGSTASTPEVGGERPLVLANGQPNLQGPWVTKSFGRNREGISPQYVATEAGKAAVGDYDMAFDDPILRCHIVNIFNAWNHDQHVNDVIQEDDKITLQYGFMDFVRTIYLDQDQHPEILAPSAGGHSIGRWDGDTLLVDTFGFEEGVLAHRSGMKHSEQMHVVERFHFDAERQYLVREYSVTDPLYLEGVVSGEDYMALSAVPYSPYNCVELSGDNNIRPADQTPEPVSADDTPWWKFWD